METIKTLLKSRTVWTVFAMFIIGGFTSVQDSIPAEALPYVQGVLTMMAMYFKLNPSQRYGG